MRVDVPYDLSPVSLAGFACMLRDLPDAAEYEFHFGGERWFPPFSMLLLSALLRQFRGNRPAARRRARDHENHSYAAHFGFFRSFGLQHGNAPGEAPGSSRYVPISELDVTEIRQEAFDSFQEVGDVIEGKAAELAGLLTRHQLGELQDTLTYSIREIMRNVVEHSGSEKIHICAQYWPQRHEVEVGIVDDGIGIHRALTGNPTFDELTEPEALQMALMPGISGNPHAGRGNDQWNNSGYGLYMTSRICRNGGSFLLCSGGTGIELNHQGKHTFDTDFRGTAIRLVIDTANLTALRERLQQFAAEGRIAAAQIAGANANVASTASQMLTRDFRQE